MKPLLIHIPHASLFIPEEYRKTALISREELNEENLFMCDTGLTELIPEGLKSQTVAFPYSRLYCDVERFRDGSEPMDKYGIPREGRTELRCLKILKRVKACTV